VGARHSFIGRTCLLSAAVPAVLSGHLAFKKVRTTRSAGAAEPTDRGVAVGLCMDTGSTRCLLHRTCVPLVSILTSAAPSALPYIADAAQSIKDLVPVEGWTVEWLVCVDGDDALSRSTLVELARRHGAARVAENPTRLWAAASRNRLLAHARGEWCVVLDADDLLVPTALQSWAKAAELGVRWVSFGADDLVAEQRIRYHPTWEEGPAARGAMRAILRTPGTKPLTAAMLLSTEALVRIGGWGASPIDEDTSIVLTLSATHEGFFQHEVTHLYRKHATSTMAVDRPTLYEAGQDARLLWMRRAKLLEND
jgi:hypothetical protein